MAEKIVIFEADINTDGAVQETIKLKEELVVLKAQAQKAKEQQGELSEEYLKYKAAVQSVEGEIRTQENLTKKLTSANAENAGTIAKLEAENAKLRNEQKSLNLETKEGIKRNNEINSTIDKNTAFIKKSSDSYVQQKMNIGNYASALDGLGVNIGGVVQGFIGMTKAAWAFIATPIGAVIAAIVVAVTAVYNIFKKFQPVLDWIEQKFAAVSAVISVVKDAFLALFSGTKSLSESFSGLGDAMADAAKRAQALKKAQQDLQDQQALLIESDAKAKRQIDELLLQSKDRTKSEEERIKLIDEALKIEEDAYNTKKKLAEDEYNQMVEQIAIDNRLTEQEKKNLAEKGAAYLLELQNTKAIDDEEVKSFAELSAKKEQILNESIVIREKAINRQNALLEKQQADEEKLREKEKAAKDKALEEEKKRLSEQEKVYDETLNRQAEAAKLYWDLIKKSMDEAADYEKYDAERSRTIQENKYQHRIDKARLALDAELEGTNAFYEKQKELLNKQLEQELFLEGTSAEKRQQIRQIYANAELEIERKKNQAVVGLAMSGLNNIATLAGKGTVLGKAAASAQVGISAIQGAQGAWTSAQILPFPASQIVGGTLAGLALAAGAKNIKDIWAVKSGLKGDSGGGGSSIPSGGVSVNPSIGQGIVSRSVTSNTQTTEITNQPTLVVDDVTNAQMNKDKIAKTATI